MDAITAPVKELQSRVIPALQDAGCEFIPTQSDKTVLSYDTLSGADAIDHLRSGGCLAWCSPELSVVDVDHSRHAELVYELDYRAVPYRYSASGTPDRGHIIIKAKLQDYDWKSSYGFGEIRHWRYTQLYQLDSLARAVLLKSMQGVEDIVHELLPAAVPTFEASYTGIELRIRAFVSRLLNTDFDWAQWAVEYSQARAQWNTGLRIADARLSDAQRRTWPLRTMPRSRNLADAYALMCAMSPQDECWLSQTQVGAALGLHQTSAGRLYTRLQNHGFIEAIGPMPNRGQGRNVVKWRLLR